MQDIFDARAVEQESLRMAYAVALLAYPKMSLPEFRRKAGQTRNGVLTAIFDRRGYVHALFRESIVRDEDGNEVMEITDLILSDAISSRLLNGMVDALVRHARDKGCDQMTVQMAQAPRKTGLNLVNTLEQHGFSGKVVALTRRV